MMKALTTYALAAALYATAPMGQGRDSAKAGGSDADAGAASSSDQADGPGSMGGDQSGDPSPAHAQGRRPEPRSDSASAHALIRPQVGNARALRCGAE